jgi:hypothetical protein
MSIASISGAELAVATQYAPDQLPGAARTPAAAGLGDRNRQNGQGPRRSPYRVRDHVAATHEATAPSPATAEVSHSGAHTLLDKIV